ncbi:unnamed protein product [Polarella glacialis]|jgi:hypothetical protein|uniref:Uncharacterized protein n=1 Tax=Polarella glacialis TaxID=89957 RepID=A0A813I3M2_POLGL|nr:unnamed protein product [Polarella glacialis]
MLGSSPIVSILALVVAISSSIFSVIEKNPASPPAPAPVTVASVPAPCPEVLCVATPCPEVLCHCAAVAPDRELIGFLLAVIVLLGCILLVCAFRAPRVPDVQRGKGKTGWGAVSSLSSR